jgi:hypothetical protein
MTETQRVMFREVLDLNWDMKQETNISRKFELAKELGAATERLKMDMGEKAYDQFIETGRRMFAPIQEAEVIED